MFYLNLFSSTASVSVLNDRLLTVISTKLSGPGLTPVKAPVVTAPVVPPPVVQEPTEPEPEVTEPPVVQEPTEPEPEVTEPPVVQEPTEPEPEVTEPPVVQEPTEPEPEVTEPPVVQEPTEPEPEVTEPPVVQEPTEPEPEPEPEPTAPEVAEPPVTVPPDEPQIVFGGRSDDNLGGGNARDTFVVSSGFGSDTVTGFAAATGGDYLRVQNYGFTSFAAFLKAARQVQSDVVIDLSSTETVTLKDVKLSEIVAENVWLDFMLPASGAPTSWIEAKTEGATHSGTAGNDKLYTSKIDLTLVGGTGDDTYDVASPETVIIEKAGAGIDTVNSWSPEGYRLSNTQSLENLTLMGKSNAWGMGNDLDNIIIGNEGNNIVGGGRGNDILTGGAGRDAFVVVKGEGSDVITDLSIADRDVVRLDGTGFKSFADVKAAMTQIGVDTVIDLGGEETLTLRGVAADALSEESFGLEIDYSSMIQTFGDEFNTFSRSTEGVGTWQTSFSFGGNAAYGFDTEQQAYVDPEFRGLEGSEAAKSLGLNPFSIEDGKLIITAEPVKAGQESHFGGLEYTSGVITSESSFWQTYGYFEMSATLPEAAGTWPTFWLLPADKVVPAEIDVMENLGDRTDAYHIASHSEGREDGQWVPLDNSISANHVYAVKWTPYDLTYYIDGKQVYSYSTPEDMNRAMYLIANLAMGGWWAGDPAEGTVAEMAIDYIRTYQLSEYTLENYTLKVSASPTTTINGPAGTAGADLIEGKGTDRLVGGEGDDTYLVSSSQTTITEQIGHGVDTVLSSASFTLGSYVENLTLTGSAQIDATGNTMSNIITGNSGANTIVGGQGNDILTGGEGKDTFVFQRGDGSDIITDFTPGSDVARLLDFGFSTFEEVRAAMSVQGKDVYLRLSAYETLVFRDVSIGEFSARDFELPVKPTLSQESIKWYFGSEGDDTFYGTGSNETFIGFGGKDILAGGLGDDIYDAIPGGTIIERAGEGIDTVESWQGDYVLPDNIENLVMKFGTGGSGNGLANHIQGSDGNDTINGKGGNDWLVGGLGNDTFVIERGNGFDVIEDFTTGKEENDVLRLVGFGTDAYLTNSGDVYSVHHAGGVESFRLIGVTDLSTSDYAFA